MTTTKRNGIRQAFTASVLALAVGVPGALLLGVQPAHADTAVRYVAPVASGLADGSSWANAADLPNLPRMVSAVGAGGQVLLRADAGAYTALPINLRRGGLDGAPVTIRGVAGNGMPMPASIVGVRTSPYSPTGRPGDEVFRLYAGTSHLRFSDMSFTNVGTAYRIAGDISDIGIDRVSANNVRRFLGDQATVDGATATVDHLSMTNVSVKGFSKNVAELLYDSHDILMQDVTGDSQQQDGDNYAMGVHLDGTAHDVTLRRVSMSNALDTTHPYWNGDGFALEDSVYNVLLDQTTSTGNSDAGYDIKASHVTLNSVLSSDNKKNLRLWGTDVTVNDSRLLDPHLRGGLSDPTQIWMDNNAQAVLNNCTIADSSAATVVFAVGTASNLSLVGGSVSYASGAALRRGPLTATVLMSGTTVTRTGATGGTGSPTAGAATPAAGTARTAGRATPGRTVPARTVTPGSGAHVR